MPNDSLSSLLCRTWKINFAFAEGIKHERNEIPKSGIYEVVFNRDSTFQIIGERTTTGRWCHDQEKKYVELELRGRINLVVFSINKNEMIITYIENLRKKISNLPDSFIYFVPK
ncbi:MAG: hypothetical protein EOO50_13340 [Flavobacterium sp.]|uniref:hypothetical protein n=1 Tax=Flavobacterium sp. TaxID=239 RepID=UPI00120C0DCD|nr:hypothetical protein [Flavobacterium sp.]RZJ65525.1 MAG: hypothetical protein EOO50_13340 [Flavobacterium sp.]